MSSSAPFDSSFEAFREQSKNNRGLRLTERFCDVSHFLLRLRVQLQYGRLSRAPIQLLRLQLAEEVVECDLLARAGDPWDADLPDRVARRHVTLQTLRDAIDLRALLFRSVPEAKDAYFRIYRKDEQGSRELVVAGNIHRNDQSARGVHSLAVRARALGFRFRIENDRLYPITDDGFSLQDGEGRDA
jgi:hypothetical protein